METIKEFLVCFFFIFKNFYYPVGGSARHQLASGAPATCGAPSVRERLRGKSVCMNPPALGRRPARGPVNALTGRPVASLQQQGTCRGPSSQCRLDRSAAETLLRGPVPFPLPSNEGVRGTSLRAAFPARPVPLLSTGPTSDRPRAPLSRCEDCEVKVLRSLVQGPAGL